jgi:hypothetical protein
MLRLLTAVFAISFFSPLLLPALEPVLPGEERLLVWQLGTKLGVAAAGSTEPRARDEALRLHTAVGVLAARLGLEIPSLPASKGDRVEDSVRALGFVRVEAGPTVGRAVAERLGEPAAALFRFAFSTANPLIFYDPTGVGGGKLQSDIVDELERFGPASGLSGRDWSILPRAMRTGKSFEEVKDIVFNLHRSVECGLTAGLMRSAERRARSRQAATYARVTELGTTMALLVSLRAACRTDASTEKRFGEEVQGHLHELGLKARTLPSQGHFESMGPSERPQAAADFFFGAGEGGDVAAELRLTHGFRAEALFRLTALATLYGMQNQAVLESPAALADLRRFASSSPLLLAIYKPFVDAVAVGSEWPVLSEKINNFLGRLIAYFRSFGFEAETAK